MPPKLIIIAMLAVYVSLTMIGLLRNELSISNIKLKGKISDSSNNVANVTTEHNNLKSNTSIPSTKTFKPMTINHSIQNTVIPTISKSVHPKIVTASPIDKRNLKNNHSIVNTSSKNRHVTKSKPKNSSNIRTTPFPRLNHHHTKSHVQALSTVANTKSTSTFMSRPFYHKTSKTSNTVIPTISKSVHPKIVTASPIDKRNLKNNHSIVNTSSKNRHVTKSKPKNSSNSRTTPFPRLNHHHTKSHIQALSTVANTKSTSTFMSRPFYHKTSKAVYSYGTPRIIATSDARATASHFRQSKRPGSSKQRNLNTSVISVHDVVNKMIQKRCNSTVTRIYKRFHVLQNPKNCTTARKLICGKWPTGMGSVVHHWVDCLIYAYNTNRTMLIDVSKWAYLKSVKNIDGIEKFEDLFLPVSKCQYNDNDKRNEVNWTSSMDRNPNSKIHAIRLDHNYYLYEHFRVVPITSIYSMPNDIIDGIVDFKHVPIAWWVGLMANYVIRPNKQLKKFILQSIIKFKFQSPIVGLHIRRTDKVIREGKAFSIESYMARVHQFYNNITKHKTIDQKRVFVCTDEPGLIQELIKQYPNYTFIHPSITELTSDFKKTRYSAKHLKYFIRDVYLLALSDYLVVTMSSNVGRLAYELHELFYIESHSPHFTSLDRNYHIISLWRDKRGISIMRAIKNCSAINSIYINIRIDDILDYDPKVNSTKDIYYGYSRRLKKFGYFRSDCVRFIINKWNYRDYSPMDSTIGIENGTVTSKYWGGFYCRKEYNTG